MVLSQFVFVLVLVHNFLHNDKVKKAVNLDILVASIAKLTAFYIKKYICLQKNTVAPPPQTQKWVMIRK